MRSAGVAVMQILLAGVCIAAIGALAGFLVGHFAHLGSAKKGLAWGMTAAGVLIALVTGQSGSPSANFQRGRMYRSGLPGFNNPTRSIPLPESPLQVALGGLLAFGAGIAVFVLFGY